MLGDVTTAQLVELGELFSALYFHNGVRWVFGRFQMHEDIGTRCHSLVAFSAAGTRSA
jgi:hypothetical protein